MARIVKNQTSDLLRDGFARRMADKYLNMLLFEDDNDMFDPAYRSWAHRHGFCVESACAFGLNEDNIDDYLPDYDYFRVWPLNSWQRIWINDKLTLKYALAGTEYDKFLPEYYYYNDGGKLVPLLEAGGRKGMDGFLEVLREKGEFACKPCNGWRAMGFNKLGYKDGTYLVDNKPATEEDVRRFVVEHPNDVYTEFFHPGMGLQKISPVIHTLRLITLNESGADPVIAGGYMRFATGTNNDDSKANFEEPWRADVYMYHTNFDHETGRFFDGRIVYGNKVVPSEVNPDTGASGSGIWPNWDKTRDMVLGLCERLGPVEYMGFDLCVTPDGPKLIEINSHPGPKYLQVYRPFMKDPLLHDYFQRKMDAIASLDADGIRRRNAISH